MTVADPTHKPAYFRGLLLTLWFSTGSQKGRQKNGEDYFQVNSQECIQLEMLFFDLSQASLKPLSLFQKKQIWKQMEINEEFIPAIATQPKMSSLEWSLLNTTVQLKGCLWSLHTVKHKYLPTTYWELPHERKNMHSINSAGMKFSM